MPRYWNLKNNKFEDISEQEAYSGDYDEVKTLEGDTIFVPRSTDGYGATLTKARQKVIEGWNVYIEFFKDDGNLKQLLETFERLPTNAYIASIILNLKFLYLFEFHIQDERFNESVLEERDYLLRHLVFIDKPYKRKLLSKTVVDRIRKDVDSLDLRELSNHFGLNSERLSEMQIGEITRVYSKAFVKDGVGFVLGRIISKHGITVAREGVSEGQSAEHVELELLKRISQSAVGQGAPVKVISSQANIVYWINNHKIAKTKTHLKLRSEVMAWLTEVGCEAKQMTEEQNKAYRAEKRSGIVS